MKIGQVEFTWRAHRQACVVKIDRAPFKIMSVRCHLQGN